jgi:PAS domain S-box-containing protein
MKAGANDYVIKEQIKRLPFAIKEAIEKSEARREKEKIGEQLRRTLDEYHDLINAMNETVWIIDLNGVLLDVNDTAVKVLGYSRDELIQMGIFGVDNYLSRNEIEKLVQDMQNEKSQFFHTWHTTRDGRDIPVEINSSRITYRGNPAILSVARDITERIKIEDRLQLLSRSVEESPVGIVVTNRDGIIEYVNSAFTNISGYVMEEILGKTPRILKSGKHSDSFYRKLWKTILSGKVWRGEIVNRRKNAELYWTELSISPIINKEGEITHFVSVREDITEKRKMIDELVASKEKAEESDRLKSAFLANMSHEIRTPMNGILGFTDLLSEPNLSGEDQEKFISIIQKSGKRMLDTVNNIIEISKIETSQVSITLNEININKHLYTLCSFFEQEATKKGNVLELENLLPKEEAAILLDKVKIDSVLTNLINNAIKFTTEGKIQIGVVRKNEFLQFYVRDSGAGIPENKLGVIFDRFMQAELGISRGYEGSGLGLSIAKSYIEMHGGEIWVESNLGKGTCFFFTIPYKPIYQKSTEKKKKEFSEFNVKKAENINLLIVEDDKAAKEYLETLLKKSCSEMLFASNGIEAIEKVRNNPGTNFVLMDLKMPLMDGYEATRKIKEINKDIKIIAQTAFALTGDKEKAMAAGCDDYVTKPINKKFLFDVINKHL